MFPPTELPGNGNRLLEDDPVLEGQLAVVKSPSVAMSYVGKATGKKNTSTVESIFFFQPLTDGRTVGYTTFLGEQLQFDLLVQPFTVKQAEFDHDTGKFSSIAALAEGEPITCALADIPFETITETLQVWHARELYYQVSVPMPFSSSGLS